MKKKVNVFGKAVPVFVIAILAMGLVSAALIGYFGQITGNVTVSQGLFVDGKDYEADIIYSATTTSFENPVILSVHYLDNQASVNAEVEFDYVCSTTAADCTGIDTKYYETNLREGSLRLSKKDSSWHELTVDSDDVIVEYTTNTNGELIINSIDWNTEDDYTLVYYADEEFDNDGVRLTTPGQAYELTVGNVVPISQDDGNLKDEADYCTFDGYAHCKGIKLWAIRTADLPSGNTIIWNTGWQSAYYFETDMLGWNHLEADKELTNPVDVASITQLDFVIVSEFQKMMMPGTYTLTTRVEPTA